MNDMVPMDETVMTIDDLGMATSQTTLNEGLDDK